MTSQLHRRLDNLEALAAEQGRNVPNPLEGLTYEQLRMMPHDELIKLHRQTLNLPARAAVEGEAPGLTYEELVKLPLDELLRQHAEILGLPLPPMAARDE